MSQKHISVDYLARVEGEGAIDITVSDGRVSESRFAIFEPPRLFEAFLVGRTFQELPDLVPRICGICPVAYQMSGVHAAEYAFGVSIDERTRRLRRLLYCGEWLESHLLHMFMLAAPDFLGYGSIISMIKDFPTEVERGLSMKRLGNDIVDLLGGRAINPVGVRVGGFHKPPTKSDMDRLAERLKHGKEQALETVKWMSGFPLPDNSHDMEFVSLSHPSEYPMNEGRVVSSKGMDIPVDEFEQHFVEHQVPYSNALQATGKEGRPYFVGPLARVNLNFEKLSPDAQAAARDSGVTFPSSNSFSSIIARAVEVVHCIDEALQIATSYEPPPYPGPLVIPRAGRGAALTEAPRGSLYHRYDFDEQGIIRKAVLIPPTAQNQLQIEKDLEVYVPKVIDRPLDEARHQCEMLVRNYDPCISCSTHSVKVRIHREN